MVTSKSRTSPLTKDELYEHALAIADAEGLEALTMRRLAADVGVEAASLYHHLPNKDALLDGVVMKMRAEVRIPDPLPQDWKELMASIFDEYRRVLAAHPNLMSLAGRSVETDPEGLVFITQLGFSDDRAVELWQSMTAFATGFAMYSSAYSQWQGDRRMPDGLVTRMAEWRDETSHKTLRMLLDAYDAERNTQP